VPPRGVQGDPEIEEAVGTAAAAAAISHGAALGETASSFAGGTPGLSDSFASTFGWVDKLGLSASLGLRRVFRQDLVSANAYTLFDLRDGAVEVPTPDYYASLLWRRLMGTARSAARAPACLHADRCAGTLSGFRSVPGGRCGVPGQLAVVKA
jgi:hypothetical protein